MSTDDGTFGCPCGGITCEGTARSKMVLRLRVP